MSDFLTNMLNLTGASSSSFKSAKLNPKILASVVLATSVGLLWKYNTLKTGTNLDDSISQVKQNETAKLKRAHRMISRIPMVVDNLHEYTWYEIQAITRRNTIKNKLIGRAMKSNFCQKSTQNENKESKISSNDTNLAVKNDVTVSEAASKEVCDTLNIKVEEKAVGSSSIYSTSSVTTSSSES